MYHFIKLFKLIKKIKPDILHVEQGDRALSYLESIVCAKLAGVKTKNLFFTWINWTPPKTLSYKMIWCWIEKIIHYFSHGAFVGNNDGKKLLEEKKFNKQVFVLPQLGIDQTIFRPAQKVNTLNPTRQKLTVLPQNIPNILCFIGRLVEEKGIFLLLDAFNTLKEKYPNWILEFIGTGPCKESLLANISEKNLSNKVFITPPITHHEIAKKLHSVDILILPSYDTPEWREQFGHVLIEAMASRVPVIGSSAGEIPYVIKNTGLIFEQKNINSLIACLNTLMQDESLRKKVGDAGYNRVKEFYTHQAIATQTYLFWSQIQNSGASKKDECYGTTSISSRN
jgi:glycosyltransferase involved in cell wall biosynthesis